MKKYIAILCVLATMLCFAACGKEYTVYEVGGYQHISDAAHTSDWKAETKYYTDDTVDKNITIEWDGKSYDVAYTESCNGYLYNSIYHAYSKMQDGRIDEFWIDTKTEEVVRFIWSDEDYAVGMTESLKSRDECLTIAAEYFTSKVEDTSEYILVSEDYKELSENDAVYTFQYARYIDGVRTSDKVTIIVTIYGDVCGYNSLGIGTMKDAKLPSDSEMKDIRKSVSQKLDAIYEPVKDKYDVNIGEEELVFMRLADGRYALQFTYENLLDAKDGSQKGLHDQAKLIVFVE